MSTELVSITEQNTIAALPYQDQQSEIKPTNIILCQRSTRAANAKPGMLMDGLSNALYEYLRIVPLADRPGRVMFQKGDDLTKPPLCKSWDGQKPSPTIENPPSQSCSTCIMGRWEIGANGKKIKPPCDETITLLGLAKPTTDESDPTYNLAGLPLYFQMRGSSLPFYKDFIKQVDRDIEVKKNQGVTVSRHDYAVTIRGQQFTSVGGYPYVAYTFSDLVRVKNVDEFGPFYQRYVLDPRKARQDQRQAEVIAEIDSKVDTAVSKVLDAEFVEA